MCVSRGVGRGSSTGSSPLFCAADADADAARRSLESCSQREDRLTSRAAARPPPPGNRATERPTAGRKSHPLQRKFPGEDDHHRSPGGEDAHRRVTQRILSGEGGSGCRDDGRSAGGSTGRDTQTFPGIPQTEKKQKNKKQKPSPDLPSQVCPQSTPLLLIPLYYHPICWG